MPSEASSSSPIMVSGSIDQKDPKQDKVAVGEEKPTPTPAPLSSLKDEIIATAKNLAAQPVHVSDPRVWGVLTAISKNAREQLQAMNILLDGDEHCFGRKVKDTKFQVSSVHVSGTHCKIYRRRVTVKDMEKSSGSSCLVYVKDSSSNGTFLNWERLTKDGPEGGVQHGDIISMVFPPEHESAFAFVYREVGKSNCSPRTVLKRKTDALEEEFGSESKKLKGLGIGASEGPISLDDVRKLQRSNKELRKQLESHALTIETLRGEIRAATVRHENELKEVKESVAHSYLDKVKKLFNMVEVKHKEVNELSTISAERQRSIEDLKERLAASMQSRTDADEIIHSQRATISELEAQLEDERNQRREEREKATSDLKAALERARTEAQEELKRQSDATAKQQREQQDVINKLQESDRESRLLVETLRIKLEDTREGFVKSEKKVRLLETQVHEEQLASLDGRKKAEKLESEIKRLRKELENEKVAREEAWAKVSALELGMAAAIRDLSIEKQRYQGARERLILRETQLRAFYSTTEEITALCAKQQEQLKSMQKTLEDEENCENTSLGIDLNTPREGEAETRPGNTAEAASPKNILAARDSTSEASMTEKHNCKPRDLGEFRASHMEVDTQDEECTSTAQVMKGFGSDIDTVPSVNVDAGNTERVLGTESQTIEIGGFGGKRFPLVKCRTLQVDTMPINDEDDQCQGDKTKMDDQCDMEGDTQVGPTIVTGDLLTSEVAGSWAVSTAPSFHGDNESLRIEGPGVDCPPMGGEEVCDYASQVGTSDCLRSRIREEEETELLPQAAGSQNIPVAVTSGRLSQERRALNEMIEIVAPGFGEQFQGVRESVVNETSSDGETKEDGGDADDGGDTGEEDGDADDARDTGEEGGDADDDEDTGEEGGDDNNGGDIAEEGGVDDEDGEDTGEEIKDSGDNDDDEDEDGT